MPCSPSGRSVQHLHPQLRPSVGASFKACAANNETGYPTNSAGGRGASATGPGIPARGGIAQTGAEAWRRACGRYSDPSHAAAYAHGCAILRRKRNHWRSGDVPKYRQRASCNGGQYRSPTPNAPLRKEVEREMDAPEGNLMIVERCIHERQHHFSCREYGWVGTEHRFAST